MCLSQHYFKRTLLSFLLFSMPTYASNLPEELLKAPINLVSGEHVTLDQYKGKKPVYLKFWATWCQPCLKQMPHFEHVHKEYGDKIEVIGINLGLNDDFNAVNKTIDEFQLTMPIAIDKNGDLAQKFRLIGTPYHLLFDRNMNLIHQGHTADESLDNKLALVAQTKANEVINAKILIEDETDIHINTDDGKVHALFFTATWCDWYLKDSRPDASTSCIIAQHTVNRLYEAYPAISWLGVISRLWTTDKDLEDYTKKYTIKHRTKIDKSNRLFHHYTVNDLPTLLVIKNNHVIAKVTDFDDIDKIAKQLNHLQQ